MMRTLAGIGSIILGLTASGAASPVAPAGEHLGPTLRLTHLVAQAGLRCRWQDGRRYCTGGPRRVPREARRSPGDNPYFVHRADELPFGSQRWWEQMSREDRAGHCCN